MHPCGIYFPFLKFHSDIYGLKGAKRHNEAMVAEVSWLGDAVASLQHLGEVKVEV